MAKLFGPRRPVVTSPAKSVAHHEVGLRNVTIQSEKMTSKQFNAV